MLFAVTSRSELAAVKPESAVLNAIEVFLY
jgi:hypothetical protein